MKFLTTQNKKIIATIGLVLTAWYVLLSGGSPLGLPAIPAVLTGPVIVGLSVLHLSVIGIIIALVMLWEY